MINESACEAHHSSNGFAKDNNDESLRFARGP
jgi:hypothetical protein